LDQLERLEQLWLNDNHIERIENVDALAALVDFNVANNRITEIGDGLCENINIEVFLLAVMLLIADAQLIGEPCRTRGNRQLVATAETSAVDVARYKLREQSDRTMRKLSDSSYLRSTNAPIARLPRGDAGSAQDHQYNHGQETHVRQTESMIYCRFYNSRVHTLKRNRDSLHKAIRAVIAVQERHLTDKMSDASIARMRQQVLLDRKNRHTNGPYPVRIRGVNLFQMDDAEYLEEQERLRDHWQQLRALDEELCQRITACNNLWIRYIALQSLMV
jgi:hypothetical protein